MATPYLFPIDPNDFFSKLQKIIEKSIDDKINPNQTLNPPNGLSSKPLFSQKEICEIFQITKPTIYDWIKHEKLKPYKIRGKVFFLQSDVQQLIESSKA